MSQSKEEILINLALIIGNIADSNSHYTAGLAARIEATGKAVMQLTVAELLELDRLHRVQFNGGNHE